MATQRGCSSIPRFIPDNPSAAKAKTAISRISAHCCQNATLSTNEADGFPPLRHFHHKKGAKPAPFPDNKSS
jgi:hypothetical protein